MRRRVVAGFGILKKCIGLLSVSGKVPGREAVGSRIMRNA